MRVNVIHPKYLADQHLVAEYREIKMGPKALSKSLYSKNGVDKNRISKEYTLNTGHTYFFYDKNKFLERRLKSVIKEMQFRGFQTNNINLIDETYSYHPSTFNEEWWNDWEITHNAIKINMDRISKRMSQKLGWYKYFGRSVVDTTDILITRDRNGFWECPNCKAIHTSPKEDNWLCWNCWKKISTESKFILLADIKKEKI